MTKPKTITDLFAHPAGTIIRLTKDVQVTVGQIVTVNLHPSGTQFDGPAVVVNAGLGTGVPSFPMVKVVSLTDPALRVVVKDASEVLS